MHLPSTRNSIPDGPLPLFPLKNVLFPGAVLPLRVFEDRYKQMVARCLEQGQGFAVALIRRGREVGGPAEPHPVGCFAEILNLDYRGDQILVTAIGTRRVRVEPQPTGQDYPTATLQPLPGLEARPEDHAYYELVRDRYAYYTGLLARVARLAKPRSGAWHVDDPLGDPGASDPAEGAYVIADGLQVASREKQRLLETDGLSEILGSLEEILSREIDRLEMLGQRFN